MNPVNSTLNLNTKLQNVLDENIRRQFPIFTHNPDICYLDSASTSQKPQSVLDFERDFVKGFYANTGRSSYSWAYQTNSMVFSTREKISQFIGSNCPEEIVFTSGATMALNLVALAWGEYNLKSGDEILFCPFDHRSINEPWFLLRDKLFEKGIEINLKPYPLTATGKIDIATLLSSVTNKTRLVNATHVNNVAGVINNIEELKKSLPNHTLINLDAAQSIIHAPIDVKSLGVDFLSFSGHKAFSSSGIGVLWVNKELHEQLQPVFAGGGQCLKNDSKQCSLPELLECGTPNLTGIASLGAALEFVTNTGREAICEYIHSLTQYLYHALLACSDINLVFPAKLYEINNRSGIAAFNIEGFLPAEIGDYLALQNIFVRYGDHCTRTKSNTQLSIDPSVRVSLNIYNTIQDIDRLLNQLEYIMHNQSSQNSLFSFV